jgi:hypothetical protein
VHKDFGGLGIPSLRDLNISLLGSWIRRYHADNGKLWKEVIDFKYNTSKPNIFIPKIIKLLSSLKASCGQQKLPKWVTDGK